MTDVSNPSSIPPFQTDTTLFPTLPHPFPTPPPPFLKKGVFLGLFPLSNTTSPQGYVGIGKVIEMDWGGI